MAHLLNTTQETTQDLFPSLVVVLVVGVRLPDDFSMYLLKFVDFLEEEFELGADSSMQFILLVGMGVDSRFTDFYFHLLLLLLHVVCILVKFFHVLGAVFVHLRSFVDLFHPLLEFAALEGGTDEVFNRVVLLVLLGEEGREQRRTDHDVVVRAFPHLAVSA